MHKLLDEHSSWAKLCEGKYFNSNLCPYNKMYRLKKLWYILSGLDIQLQESENENPVCKKLVQGCKTWQVIYHFFSWSTRIYGLVVKVSCSELGDKVGFQQGAAILCFPRAILHGTEPQSWAWALEKLLCLAQIWLASSSWGSSPALLARVTGRLESTNTGCFQVCCRLGQQLARLRKTCYHSCYTDSVQGSTRF